ncbi:MAG: hypothetical protein HBSAPP03_27840 [Phycisphaerae bacterium]|nr:MAG: hypothetical protein HBSAPP03_27840 [Phycisphaerae bacterium]
MARGMTVRRGFAGFAAAGIMLAMGPLPFTHAQQRVMSVRAIGGGPGGSAQVSKRSLERYGEVVGWDSETQETARAIHEGYVAAMEAAQKTRRAAFEEMRRSADDTGDHTVFMERMPKVETEFRETSQRLEKALFADLRALLTPAQEAQWERVERMRRREVGLREATLSGEGVDLVEVVAGLKLDEAARQGVAPALDEYEADLDRALEAKLAIKADVDGLRPMANPGDQQKSMEKMQKAMESGREASKRVQDVNTRHARRIADALPEGVRAAFDEELKKRSFPRVYRTSGVARELNGALALTDLSSEQREALASIKAQYERDLATVNDRWAAAIRESEVSSQDGAFATPAGVMRISMGDEPEPLKEARKARRELDEKTSERFKSLLTPGQKERLPKAPEERDEVGGMQIMEAATVVIEGSGH